MVEQNEIKQRGWPGTMRILPLFISALAIVHSAAQSAPAGRSETLGSIKHTYLDQRVVVYGSAGLGGLLGWQRVKRVVEGYYAPTSPSGSDYLPESYVGKSGKVVLIRLADVGVLGTNAMGETISPDEIANPYFKLVVEFDDGVLAQTTAYPNTLSGSLVLAEQYQRLQQDISKALPQLIGKTVYAVGYSQLYQPNSTFQEITGLEISTKLLDPPRLQPIQVLDAKYVRDGVVLKLKLPDGSAALSYSGNLLAHPSTAPASEDEMLKTICRYLVLEMPRLTEKEIDAVRRGAIFKGMSKDALYDALGFPKTENDWGSGGKQLVFTSKFLVYLGSDDKIVDWQELDRN
jgi:hypothetical protein